MLTIAKLTVGQERYYEQEVAGGLDDYYAGRGESPGIWAGRGAEELGLAEVVRDGELGQLLRGTEPAGGKTLRAPVKARVITVSALDPETGQLRLEPKRLAPVSGFDLVFSCPKSISLLHALTEDEEVRRQVSEAHEAAWQAALRYLEQEACVTRRGAAGVIREHGAGFVAAAFRHRMSRAQDPHLHTHVIVANMARSPDGEWRALDGQALLQTYRLAAGYLYEAHLRFELTNRLGVEWTEPVKGMGELRGVPEAALRAFSRRREALMERMEATGLTGFHASRVSALATRERKEDVDLPTLRADWRARAAEHGLGQRELRALLGRHPWHALEEDELAALTGRLLSPAGLTEKQTTFTLPELVRAIAEAHAEGAPVEGVLALAERVASLRGLRLLEDGSVPGRPARLTTDELLTLEADALERALAGRDVGAPQASDFEVSRTIAHSTVPLSSQQRMLVRRAGTSGDRVLCVVGRAGSGKTTALRALGEAFERSGVPVLGAAPSGRAAEELREASGIESVTLHHLLASAFGSALPERCLLVVDEAGMAETRVLAPILRMVEAANGKALLVGDPCQLPAVGAGGLFAAFVEHLGAIELTENRRQLDVDERRALARLRAGEPEEYLALAARRGRLAASDTPLEARSRLLSDWWQAAEHDLGGSVMLAYRRADVAELNDAARALMDEQGRLGPERLLAGEREFAAGDRVICRRNADVLGVKNSTRGTLEGIDGERGALKLMTDGGEQRTLPAWYVSAGFVEHGYALTVHAGQGATVEHAFVLALDEGALQEWGYVACSRARSGTRLYLAESGREREAHGRTIEETHAPTRLADALARSASERLALETSGARPDPRDMRRAHLEEACARAEQRLADTRAALEKLGWWDRRRRGLELRSGLTLQNAALDHARDCLARFLREPLETRHVLVRRPDRSLARLAPEIRGAPPLDRPDRRLPGIELGP